MHLTLYKKEAEDIYLYFHIHDHQRHLFDKPTITIARGDVGTKFTEKHYTFENTAEKEKKIRELFEKKIHDGYSVLYRFPKDFLVMFQGEIVKVS
jgi:hypothetical protein